MVTGPEKLLGKNLPLFRTEILHRQAGDGLVMEDFEWENALAQLDRLTNEALADLSRKVHEILNKRAVTVTVYEEAFE